jgi:hypothetical protein
MRTAPANQEVHDIRDGIFVRFTVRLAQLLASVFKKLEYRILQLAFRHQAQDQGAKLVDRLGRSKGTFDSVIHHRAHSLGLDQIRRQADCVCASAWWNSPSSSGNALELSADAISNRQPFADAILGLGSG